MLKPELLSPAGNIEKLRLAFLFGSDAVYLGGHVFGLRKYAENFSIELLSFAVNMALEQDKKIYLVLNGFAHDSDTDSLIAYLKAIRGIPLHGFIISDLGVIMMARRYCPDIPIHVSTQASLTNVYAIRFFQKYGVSRVILAREVSLNALRYIKAHTDLELEIFIHGAMCASYSGKCVISNYVAGRDSNRGGCIQSCRHNYILSNSRFDDLEKDSCNSAYIMNAKDLLCISHLPELIKLGIHSFKIEGRMKSNFYLSHVVSVYRRAIDYCYASFQEGNHPSKKKLDELEKELKLPSHRNFSEGGLGSDLSKSINHTFAGYYREGNYLGVVKHVDREGMYINVKMSFSLGARLCILHRDGGRSSLSISMMKNMDGETVEKSRPNTLIFIPYNEQVKPMDIVYEQS